MLSKDNNVNTVINLLEEKNRHLEMFLLASVKERKSFKARNFDNIDLLYETRQEILENIRCIDDRIKGYSRSMEKGNFSIDQKNKIDFLLKEKKKITDQIVDQDLVIISCIENEKSSMIKQITSFKSGRRLMKAYRQLPDIIE